MKRKQPLDFYLQYKNRSGLTDYQLQTCLPGRTLVSNYRNINMLPAMRTGNTQGNKLAHDTFRNGRDHGIDVIKSVIQHVKPLF